MNLNIHFSVQMFPVGQKKREEDLFRSI